MSDTVYFEGVCERVPDSAVALPRRRALFADGSAPQPNACHANAERYVSENPGSRIVRGWLVSSFHDYGAVFDRHSVVADAAGDLMEITPLRDDNVTFVAHYGLEAVFWSAWGGVPQVIFARAPREQL